MFSGARRFPCLKNWGTSNEICKSISDNCKSFLLFPSPSSLQLYHKPPLPDTNAISTFLIMWQSLGWRRRRRCHAASLPRWRSVSTIRNRARQSVSPTSRDKTLPSARVIGCGQGQTAALVRIGLTHATRPLRRTSTSHQAIPPQGGRAQAARLKGGVTLPRISSHADKAMHDGLE